MCVQVLKPKARAVYKFLIIKPIRHSSLPLELCPLLPNFGPILWFFNHLEHPLDSFLRILDIAPSIMLSLITKVQYGYMA